MTFYFQPPIGIISYQKMEMYALNRLKFLLRLNACKDEHEQGEVVCDAQAVQWSDCLIEGTVKDTISHYLLRLTLGNSSDMRQFLCKAETRLFCLRLRNFNKHEWKTLFTSVDKALRQQCDHDNTVRGLSCLVDILKSHFGSIHGLSRECAFLQSCDDTITVPFQLLMSLIATRSVSLQEGMACLPVSRMIEVLSDHFHKILSSLTRKTRSRMKNILADERIHRLSCVVKRAFMSEAYTLNSLALKSQAFTFTSLKMAMHLFPPCMSELISKLHTHHRLHHHDRIQLTLFLKELGLPLHEALLFWKREYSQKTCSSFTGNCPHSWQGNERKYTYNIRHLYGLEGRHIQYRAHSCHAIQEKQVSSYEHGQCPFLSSDLESLSSLLTRHKVSSTDCCVNRLSYLSTSKQFGKACSWFLLCKRNSLKEREKSKRFNDSAGIGFIESSILPKQPNGLDLCGLSNSNLTNEERNCSMHMNNEKSIAQVKEVSTSSSVCYDDFKPREIIESNKTLQTLSMSRRRYLLLGNEREIEGCPSSEKICRIDDSVIDACAFPHSSDDICYFEPSVTKPSGSKKRKFSSTELCFQILNEKDDDNENQKECFITKPSHYYWTFRSLLDGLKNCETST